DEATAALRHAAVGATRVLGAGPGAPKTGRGVVGTLITSMSFLSLARGLGSDHRGRECAAPGLFCCGGTLPPVTGAGGRYRAWRRAPRGSSPRTSTTRHS